MPRQHKATYTIVGSCHVWNGPKDHLGRPITHHKGKPIRVQHAIFQSAYNFPPGQVKLSCGRKDCINPEHMMTVAPNPLPMALVNEITHNTKPTPEG